MAMTYFCCDPRRLEVVKLHGSLNGIEFVEVHDHLESDLTLRQRTLFVRLLRPGFALTPDNLLISGGERVPQVAVEWVAAANALPPGTPPALVSGIDDLARTLVVRTRSTGDFSRYTLHIRASSGSSAAPADFDPRLADIGFSFKVECPTDFDCAATVPCPAPVPSTPDIDYLAKDFTGFRRLMLDRMNLLAPGWAERSTADLGVVLVELMAYAADNLSYRQDAVANEAYLHTARRRVSVRRHARLVDYALHDGCNARAWVQLQVAAATTVAAHTPLLTHHAGLGVQVEPGSPALRSALAAGVQVFETAVDAELTPDLNTLHFYTWGDQACCLPRGATTATLRGAHPALRVNDVLVLQEVCSPTLLTPQDANRTHRWAVRLTGVQHGIDPSGQLFDTPPVDAPLPVTDITWDSSDALPFALCLSVPAQPGLPISVALGNIVLADHGHTVVGESLGTVPPSTLKRVAVAAVAGSCSHPAPTPVPVRYRPTLASGPLTQATPAGAWLPASATLAQDPHGALPAVAVLTGELDGVVNAWAVRRDLLASAAGATDFVVETDNDGTTQLRFGDDHHGQRPDEGTHFTASYRVGNGVAGNVGMETIAHIVTPVAGVYTGVANPLAAAGGTEPETLDAARRDAPQAYRTQERAVTAADYAAATERRAEVQRAAATFRWTGSWHTVFVTADRVGGAAPDAPFTARLQQHLAPFRMAGYDLAVDGPRYVALDVELHLCVLAGHFRADVVRAVGLELGTTVLPGGRLALFHPDNFSFGQAVYLSQVIARAQAVTGVEAVAATRFTRLASPETASLDSGVITLGRLQIAQLANDPNFRERGRLTLKAGGGL
jgi:CBS domain-containing protein